MDENALSNVIIGAAIEVHKQLGLGLLESAYEECLAFELNERSIVLTYLKLTGCKLGLLLNFNVVRMRNGIKRLVFNL